MNFLRERTISQAASDLIEFDSDSIRQIVAAQHHAAPDIWIVDPDGYEKNGRVLRDSDSPRLLAYSTGDQVLYATDGCNSCTRRFQLSNDLNQFAGENGIKPELIEKLVSLCTVTGS